MNKKMIVYVLGRTLLIEAVLLVLPLITAVIYGESVVPFLIPIVLLLAIGFITGMKKPKNASLFARDGLAVVALVWIFMSAFGGVFSIPTFLFALYQLFFVGIVALVGKLYI